MSSASSDLEARREDARRRLVAEGVRVLLEDNHLLVVSKPPGLASQSGPSIDRHLAGLLDAYRREAEAKEGRAYVGLVHRLDRNVGGVMVVAKTSKAAGRLAKAFRERAEDLEKEYVAWIGGHPKGTAGELRDRLRREDRVTRATFSTDPQGRDAHLSWSLEARGRRASRLRILLHTGLAHQIRAQLSLFGHPILGDVKYGGRRGRRLGLYARRLAFSHPVGGAPVEVVAPVPESLCRLDAELGMDPPVADGGRCTGDR